MTRRAATNVDPRFALVNHDAIRHGILRPDELPQEEIEILGPRGSKRIDRLVHDLVETSAEAGEIRQSDEVGGAMLALRAFMFERVYLGPQTRREHDRARETVRRIFDGLAERGDEPDAIVDYLSGMTDRFALDFAARL